MAMFESVGKALIRARERARLKNQMEAARVADVGQPQLSGWENGTKEVRLSNLGKILEAWGLTATQFGQLIDEINGQPAGNSVGGNGSGINGSHPAPGTETLGQASQDAHATLGLMPVVDELRSQLSALRQERDDLNRCLAEVFSTVLAENRRGQLPNSTARVLLSSFLAFQTGEGSPLLDKELGEEGSQE